jgi:hypothetical protein
MQRFFSYSDPFDDNENKEAILFFVTDGEDVVNVVNDTTCFSPISPYGEFSYGKKATKTNWQSCCQKKF